jgi:hypothetical protein
MASEVRRRQIATARGIKFNIWLLAIICESACSMCGHSVSSECCGLAV